jgi:diaminopimelate decarboxylase
VGKVTLKVIPLVGGDTIIKEEIPFRVKMVEEVARIKIKAEGEVARVIIRVDVTRTQDMAGGTRTNMETQEWMTDSSQEETIVANIIKTAEEMSNMAADEVGIERND